MSLLAQLSIPALALLVFGLRIVDVSLGTLRTISVVHGRVRISVAVGFVEVLIWITAISQVISRVNESPLLLLAYAGGFAAGSAGGIALERTLRLGRCVVRIISEGRGTDIADVLRTAGHSVTTFRGEGEGGARLLIYTTCRRRDLGYLLDRARALDPSLYYAVERFSETSEPQLPTPGWRAVFKMK